jgi:zinc transporter 1/2/3
VEILWFKIVFLLVIFAMGLFAGIAPLRMGLSPRGKRRLSWGNAFSGGVFLGAGLLHMLPDAGQNFQALAPGVDYPVSVLICGTGFLFVLLLEKAALGGSEDVGSRSKGRPVYPFLLCLILSVHSIIVGVSLGLEATLASSIGIFTAIIAHKGPVAFSLGVSLRKNEFPFSLHVQIVCFFAAMAPLGILLGIIFSTILADRSTILFEAVFDALAAGTFLYIAGVDIIEEVFEKYQDRWTKFGLILCGYLFMALLAI